MTSKLRPPLSSWVIRSVHTARVWRFLGVSIPSMPQQGTNRINALKTLAASWLVVWTAKAAIPQFSIKHTCVPTSKYNSKKTKYDGLRKKRSIIVTCLTLAAWDRALCTAENSHSHASTVSLAEMATWRNVIACNGQWATSNAMSNKTRWLCPPGLSVCYIILLWRLWSYITVKACLNCGYCCH